MPIGYTWDRHVGLELDPDRRLQEVIRLVFQKFREPAAPVKSCCGCRRRTSTFPTHRTAGR
jgi:hypothetical protein